MEVETKGNLKDLLEEYSDNHLNFKDLNKAIKTAIIKGEDWLPLLQEQFKEDIRLGELKPENVESIIFLQKGDLRIKLKSNE